VTDREPSAETDPAEDLPDHVARNRAGWDVEAAKYVEPGERFWRLQPGEESWGLFGIPESQLGMLPDDLAGLDAIELGCGTGYVSAWLARRGARPVGIDNSAKQLETADRLQEEHGIVFPLVHGNAERVPYPDASFDFAISEYGAVLWADPEVWVPEAARLLRPGGRLHVLTNHHLAMLTTAEDAGEDDPLTDRLVRDYFRGARTEWPDDNGVEFHPTHGEWIRIFRDAGFEIVELLEPQVPEGSTTSYAWAPYEWARRWPIEEIWKVRKRG
jgi:ubiquinone/menaquinone biosynthesis C-methylase UbiE